MKSSLHLVTGEAPPSEPPKTQFSFRLESAHKVAFSDAARRCGLDPSAAARCAIELIVQRLERGEDLLAVLRSFMRDGGSLKATPESGDAQ